jgi:hypothetical protein
MIRPASRRTLTRPSYSNSEPYLRQSISSNQSAHGEVNAGRSFEAHLPIHRTGSSVGTRREHPDKETSADS